MTTPEQHFGVSSSSPPGPFCQGERWGSARSQAECRETYNFLVDCYQFVVWDNHKALDTVFTMFTVQSDAGFEMAAMLCSAVAAGYDVHSRRIPNVVTGTGFIAALVLHAAAAGASGVADALGGASIGFGVTLLFFLAGGMGAGDVKLMGAIGALVGWHEIGTVLLSAALWGALFAVIVAQRRGRLREVVANTLTLTEHHRTQGLVPHPRLHLRSEGGLRIPFAIPTALGCLTTIIWLRAGRG